MRKNKFQFFIFLFVICQLPVANSLAQSIANSPYSRFGLGELQYSGLAHNIASGGISYALQNDTAAPYYFNPANPASHASTRLTVFDFGLNNSTVNLETDSKKFKTNKTSIAYLAFAFPVAKWWGASFGFLPYSNVGYKIFAERDQDSIGTVKYSYEGEGGINQLYLGNGFKHKNFSAGVNASYLFGSLVYSSRDSFPKASNFFNSKFTQTNNVNDLYLSFGAQYRQPLKKGWSITFGAAGSAETNIAVKRTSFAATYENDFGVEIVKDTVLYEEDVKDTVTIPMMVGGGIVLKKGEKFLIGIDYSTQNWSEFSDLGQRGFLKNSQRASVGIQYIPNKNAGAKESYMKKIFYRAGLKYSDTYLELNNTALKEYAVTFGFGFPLRKTKVGETFSQSIINVGVELGQRGTTDNNLILEKYSRVVVSFTLNDRWFIKRKYD